MNRPFSVSTWLAPTNTKERKMKKKIALCVALGCATAFAATNYDLLGRNGSKKNTPMVYRDADYLKMKAAKQQGVNSPLENKALMRSASGLNYALAMEGAYNSRGLDGPSKVYYTRRYFSGGVEHYGYYETLTASGDYFDVSNVYFIPTYLVQNYTPAGIVETDTASRMYGFNLSENYNNSSLKSFWDLEYNQNDRLRRGDISWFDNGYYDCQECADVGLYIDADSYPVRLNPSKTTVYTKYAGPDSINNISHHEYEVPASKAYSILQATTKNTSILMTRVLPEDPGSRTPQVYVGLHNRPNNSGDIEMDSYYSEAARDLDDYIYANRTVEIVAAGNNWVRNNFGQLNAQAHAANAITVGAVNASTGKIVNTTSTTSKYCGMGIGHCRNGQYTSDGSSKPEVYNFSEFFMPGDYNRTYTHWFTREQFPYTADHQGTEAAAAYTANMVAGLLRANPFYRWHPEVVKALLITSGEINIVTPYPSTATPVTTKVPTYKSVVSNRAHADYFHDSRYWIGQWSKLCTHSLSGKRELRFSVKRPSGKRNFSAAIAWLSSGSDIARFGELPQNFDLYVYENTTDDIDNIVLNQYKVASESGKNAFEKVNFWSNAQYLTFRIVLKSEKSGNSNPGQAVLGFDLASGD